MIEPIPKYIRPRATALLNRLKARPDVITWDKTGQIKIEGQSIPNSNISDLVSDALRSRKNFNPTGASEFFHALSKMNMPKELVRNQERWTQVIGTPDAEDFNTPQSTTASTSFSAPVKKSEGIST